MTLKDLWSKVLKWLRYRQADSPVDYPHIDDEGLITEQYEPPKPLKAITGSEQNHVVVKTVLASDKNEPIQRLQEGFQKLIGQLEGINEHLGRQTAHHEELMNRLEKLPQLIENLPAIINSQNREAEKLFELLNLTAAKQQQFTNAVEKIPAEAARQTSMLIDIDHQLAAAADADVQMAEGFNKFNETLEILNQNTTAHSDSIAQMSRTFAASDRYFKYIISRQNRRFMWAFYISAGVCISVILILTGIIIYLKSY